MSVAGWARGFKVMSVIMGLLSLLVLFGAVGIASFLGLMAGGTAAEILVAIWTSLSIGKFLVNSIFLVLSFFSFNSAAAVRNPMVFLVIALTMALWDYMSFPHNIAYFYFLYWLVYSVFIVLNRRAYAHCLSAEEKDGEEGGGEAPA